MQNNFPLTSTYMNRSGESYLFEYYEAGNNRGVIIKTIWKTS